MKEERKQGGAEYGSDDRRSKEGKGQGETSTNWEAGTGRGDGRTAWTHGPDGQDGKDRRKEKEIENSGHPGKEKRTKNSGHPGEDGGYAERRASPDLEGEKNRKEGGLPTGPGCT